MRLITIPTEQNNARVSDDASGLSVAPTESLLCEARFVGTECYSKVTFVNVSPGAVTTVREG